MKYSFATVFLCLSSFYVSACFGQTAGLLQALDNPTPSGGDAFGFSVAIDGNSVLVGAFGDNTNGDSVGQAYLFDATTGNLVLTFDDPTVTRSDNFGYSVAIDGNHVLVGDRGDSMNVNRGGQAHLFSATTGNLISTFDSPTPDSVGRFGCSVAIDGNHVIIGDFGDSTFATRSGQAYLFDATTGNLLFTFNDPSLINFASFGRAVAIDSNHNARSGEG